MVTVIVAEPDAVPSKLDAIPSRVARDRGSVVPGGLAGLAGSLITWITISTVQVLAATGPVLGPRLMFEVGVSCTSPVVPFGAPTVNPVPAQGVVPALPVADWTLNTPGS